MTELAIEHQWDGTPLPAAERTTLRLEWQRDALRIEVDAPFNLDPAPPFPRGPVPKLWEHEVVELFAVGPDQRYTEIELGPYGHHLVLHLDGVRNIVAEQLPIQFTATIDRDFWHGVALVPRAHFRDAPLTCNAYRVAGRPPDRRWHAMRPTGGERPDFHRLDVFAPWPL